MSIPTYLYSSAPSPSWLWLYYLLISIAVTGLFVHVVMKGYKHPLDAPLWIQIFAVIRMITFFNPYGLITWWALFLAFLAVAPIGASVIVFALSVFSIYCIYDGLGLVELILRYSRIAKSKK